MTYEPLIAAARRRARMLQKADGRSYQVHLEEVARQSGAADWSSFLAEPRSVPSSEADNSPRNGTESTSVREGLVLAYVRLAAIAGGAIGLSSINLPLQEGDAMVRRMLVGASIMAVCSLIPSTMETVPWIRFVVTGKRPSATSLNPDRSRIARRIVYWMIAMMALCSGVLVVRNHVGQDEMARVLADRSGRAAVRIKESELPLPVASTSVVEGRSKFRVVVLDDRLGWASFRKRIVESAGLRADPLTYSFIDNPVIRMAGEMDCRTGRWRAVGLETASSYDSRSAYVRVLERDNGWRKPADPSDVSTLCDDVRA